MQTRNRFPEIEENELPKPPKTFKSIKFFYQAIRNKVNGRRKHSLILSTAAKMGIINRQEYNKGDTLPDRTIAKHISISYGLIPGVDLTPDLVDKVAAEVNKIVVPALAK